MPINLKLDYKKIIEIDKDGKYFGQFNLLDEQIEGKLNKIYDFNYMETVERNARRCCIWVNGWCIRIPCATQFTLQICEQSFEVTGILDEKEGELEIIKEELKDKPLDHIDLKQLDDFFYIVSFTNNNDLNKLAIIDSHKNAWLEE